MADGIAYTFTKIWELDPKAGSTNDPLRDWLPVTAIDQNEKRITVRVPYPIGDYDLFKMSDPDDYDCPYCAGTGVDSHGNTCEECHGTCVIDALGPITVNADGVIHMSIDRATLGVDPDGKLYAHCKLKENGGLKTDENDAVYVSIDNHSIKINQYGQLYVELGSPYSVTCARQIVDPSQSVDLLTVDDPNVSKIKLHVTVELDNTSNYTDTIELTQFRIVVNNELPNQVSQRYCWDQTSPYTVLSFDTIMDVAAPNNTVQLSFDMIDNDTIPETTGVYVSANAISC